MRTKIKAILLNEQTDYTVTIKGWVRSFRNNQFIAMNDGSTINNLQVVIDFENMEESLVKSITTGAALSVEGTVIASQGKGQRVEVKATKVELLGECNAEEFPLQLKNKPSLEYLREIAHLRFRTNTFGAIFRVRHSLAFAIHKFFNEKGFVYLHTPIVTASDAEGAGEMFRVTTLPIENVQLRNRELEKDAEIYAKTILSRFSEVEIKEFNQVIKTIEKDFDFKKLLIARPSQLRNLYFNRKNHGILINRINDLESKLSCFFERIDNAEYFSDELAAILKTKKKKVLRRFSKDILLKFSFFNFSVTNARVKKSTLSEIDFEDDFFGRATNLTVSGQLEAELGAMALGEVYTFGPTFRAENSNTARHLAEFWMVEPEVAFNDIKDNADLAEEFIQYIIKYALDNNREDLEFLANRLVEEEKSKPQAERSEMGLIEKLEFVLQNKFERITYTEAIDILLQSKPYKKKQFQYEISWGTDLQSEHERFLVEKHFKKPVIVTDYPKDIKSFYMRLNDDGKTVAAMDILAPGIGEIVGGSQREERLDKLTQRMEEMHIPQEEMYWYIDSRRFGTAPHAGFGLGFERMVLFVTGMGNIRDVIPFPRTPKNADF